MQPSYYLVSRLKNSHFWIHVLILSSPTIDRTRFNENWLFVSFFCYSHCYFSLVFFYLVLFFIKRLHNDFLNFSFCKYISSHLTNICSKVVLLPGALLFTLAVALNNLNKFLLAENPGSKHFTHIALQLFWDHTSAWVFFSKFAAYFQNPFLKSTSGRLLL